ncbi:MAG: metalloregulator ArsR/SmtB family transcription factor [Candidatus Diapherotrites archaeon]
MAKNNALEVLKALSDGTRLEIVRLLLDGERCVCQIFPQVRRTQSTVSIQLATLEKAGLIKSRREGKKIFYKITDNRVKKILKAAESKLEGD